MIASASSLVSRLIVLMAGSCIIVRAAMLARYHDWALRHGVVEIAQFSLNRLRRSAGAVEKKRGAPPFRARRRKLRQFI